jgi:hypothetical protein
MSDKKRDLGLSDRGRYWQELLKQWSESGITQAEFCRRQNVSVAAFGWWKRKLSGMSKVGKRAGKDQPAVGGQSHRAQNFVELKVSPTAGMSAGCLYEVALPGGRRVRVGDDFDPQTLGRLLAVVEGSC